jgi:hypothetical protein
MCQQEKRSMISSAAPIRLATECPARTSGFGRHLENFAGGGRFQSIHPNLSALPTLFRGQHSEARGAVYLLALGACRLGCCVHVRKAHGRGAGWRRAPPAELSSVRRIARRRATIGTSMSQRPCAGQPIRESRGSLALAATRIETLRSLSARRATRAFQGFPAGGLHLWRWPGRAGRRARSAGRSKTRSETAAAISHSCMITWRAMRSSPGPGRRARAAPPRRARSNALASLSRP